MLWAIALISICMSVCVSTLIQNFAGMLLRWSPFKFMVQSSKVAYSAYTNIYYDLYFGLFFPQETDATAIC